MARPALGFGVRQRDVGSGEHGTQAHAWSRIHRAHHDSRGTGVQRGRRRQGGMQGRGGLDRQARSRQTERKVRTVEPAGESPWHTIQIGLQQAGRRDQQAVGSLMTESLIQGIQFQHAYQDQCHTRPAGTRQLRLQAPGELATQRQCRHAVHQGLALQRLHLLGLRRKHFAQPAHGGIHAARELTQFRQAGFFAFDEAAFFECLGLGHRVLQ
jgi:hypothetical protein